MRVRLYQSHGISKKNIRAAYMGVQAMSAAGNRKISGAVAAVVAAKPSVLVSYTVPDY
jgi:hypothetical protein